MNIVNVGNSSSILVHYSSHIDHTWFQKCIGDDCSIDLGHLPLLYSDLYDDNHVKAFDVMIASGTWRGHLWGDIPSIMHNMATHGGYLSVDIASRHKNNKKRMYSRVRNMIASSFCSSINVDTLNSKPINVYNTTSKEVDRWMQFFPSESLCSDHLTNLLKVLPYDGHLETLLNSKALLSSPWYSFQVSMTNTNKQCNVDSCKQDKRKDDEYICKSDISVTIQVSAILHPVHSSGHKKLVNALKETSNGSSSSTNISNSSIKVKREASTDTKRRVNVDRIVRDSRQLQLYVETRLENTTPQPLSILIIDTIPNFYDVLLNTYDLCTLIVNNSTDQSMSLCTDVDKVANIKSFHYQKSNCDDDDHDDNCFDSISWSYEIPPNSVLITSYIGLKQFMHMSVFPPDANRGIEVPPSVIYVNSFPFERLITSHYVVSLPLSDFSMSFNVITLVSTSFVFLVGTMINTLVRKNDKK